MQKVCCRKWNKSAGWKVLNMFKQMRDEKMAHIEAVLKGFLPKEEGYAAVVMEAMNYSVLAGGKRLRPMLMEEKKAS